MILSIIIVNYNTTEHVKLCLKSLSEFLQINSSEIIIVDNNSPNRNIEKLSEEFPEVRFIFRKINDGFGGGCNEGVKNASGEYLLFLNPDTILFDDSIILLLKFLENNIDAGIVSGLLTDNDGTVLYCFNDFINLGWEISQMTGIGYEYESKKLINRDEIKRNENFEVDWFHGAFLMMRRKDFISIKGFDEKYFMYYEDVDLCYKMKNDLHKKNICLPYVRIRHYTQSSIQNEKIDNILTFHMHRGKIIFLKKYYPVKKYLFKSMGFISVLLRIIILPFQSKYKFTRKEKLNQLLKILKLYINSGYADTSKFEYVNV